MIIKVGAQEYKMVERTRVEDGMLNDGNYAYTLDQGNLIVIDKDIAKTKKQITLFHELLHAIRFDNDGMPKPGKKADYDEWEHYFIAMYESNLLAVLKDNSHLVEWLTL